jgi:choline dehydrogenase-like flavoprotein
MSAMPEISLDQALSRDWNAIVIGAGMGGGLAGRRLAERGLSVLFVEKGPAGYPTEQQGILNSVHDPQARLLRGAWPKPAEARLDGVATRFFGPYGCTVGGSSVFYAAALERPERHDLDDRPDMPHPSGGWPVGWDAFLPYFEEAGALLHLCGTPDPLSPPPPAGLSQPPPMSPVDASLKDSMEANGLHPYRLHLAIRTPRTCRQCFGFKCAHNCKMDGRSAGVVPALQTGRAALLSNCDVREILEMQGRVEGLRVCKNGQDAILRAGTYVLAAGALGSPRLLLASRGTHSEGCANSSGWVGRGLTFHLDEFFVLWPRGAPGGRAGKALSLRDLYAPNGERFGLIQSVGIEADYGNIVHYLNQLYDQSPLRRFRRLRHLTRLPALIASRLFGKAALFVGILEDYPYPQNRVVLNEDDPEILTFEYGFNKELLARRRRFRRAILRAFRGHRRFLVSMRPVLNYGHPAGTLRFGNDPDNSVLTPDCRAHDLANLYVADASFMPSALGVNPSLTIAANALRVADIIAERTRKGEAS